MNDYVTLDGLRYATVAEVWEPVMEKPHTERYTLLGQLDLTYGPAIPRAWEGEIIAPVTPRAENWGDIDDLAQTLAKKEAVSFTDHDGNQGMVHCLGSHRRRSLLNRWDDPQNQFYVEVRLVLV